VKGELKSVERKSETTGITLRRKVHLHQLLNLGGAEPVRLSGGWLAWAGQLERAVILNSCWFEVQLPACAWEGRAGRHSPKGLAASRWVLAVELLVWGGRFLGGLILAPVSSQAEQGRIVY